MKSYRIICGTASCWTGQQNLSVVAEIRRTIRRYFPSTTASQHGGMVVKQYNFILRKLLCGKCDQFMNLVHFMFKVPTEMRSENDGAVRSGLCKIGSAASKIIADFFIERGSAVPSSRKPYHRFSR